MKDRTANQHYVPRCYLKYFASDSPKTNKQKIITNFFKFNGTLLKENIPIKSICSKNYFYGKDGIREKEFSKLESHWGFVLNKIVVCDEFSLTSEEILSIKEFIMWQFARTLGNFNHEQQSFFELAEDLPKSYQQNLKIDIDFVLDTFKNFINIIDDLNILIIQFDTTNKLITSDDPVININPLTPDDCGFGNIGAVLLLPVSSNKLLLLYDSKIYNIKEKYIISTNENDVDILNKYQILNSDELIISNDIDTLQHQLEDQDTLDTRNKIINSKKTIKAQSIDSGIIYNFKNKSVFYYYNLSFLKLPKQLGQLPIRFRLYNPRIFDYGFYQKLLIQRYVLSKNPSYIGTQNPKVTRKQMSHYLNFIEDYWEVPLKDRTINSDQFSKIRFKRFNVHSS